MNHLGELMSVYLDGETTPAESRRVRRHLSECVRCRQELGGLHEARTVIRSLPMLELPPNLVPAESEPERRVRRRWQWAGAAAAAVAATITVATILTPAPEPLDLADISRQYGARVALDNGAVPLKVVVPTGDGS